MLDIHPPNYKFCPMCGSKLDVRHGEDSDEKYCPNCKWIYYPHVAGSVCALVVKNNKVLLVKRNREPQKDKWMLPAGFIKYGEHPAETAKRELQEETGYIAMTAELVQITQVMDDKRPGAEGHFAFCYKCEVEEAERTEIIDKKENSAVRWFDLSSLPDIAWEDHKQILKELISKDSNSATKIVEKK